MLDTALYAVTLTTIYHSDHLRDDQKSGFFIIGNAVFSKKENAIAYMRRMVEMFCPQSSIGVTYHYVENCEDMVICKDKPGFMTLKFKVELLYKDVFNG